MLKSGVNLQKVVKEVTGRLGDKVNASTLKL